MRFVPCRSVVDSLWVQALLSTGAAPYRTNPAHGAFSSPFIRPTQQKRFSFHMAERDSETLSEEEAARLWERAAQLQAEAARRVEAPDAQGAAAAPAG